MVEKRSKAGPSRRWPRSARNSFAESLGYLAVGLIVLGIVGLALYRLIRGLSF